MNILPWLSLSSDLNPTENEWGQLKRSSTNMELWIRRIWRDSVWRKCLWSLIRCSLNSSYKTLYIKYANIQMNSLPQNYNLLKNFTLRLSKMKLCFEKIWRNIALHHLLIKGSSTVNKSPNSWYKHHNNPQVIDTNPESCPSVNVFKPLCLAKIQVLYP